MKIAASAIVPIAAVSAGLYVESKGWGLFNLLSLPSTVEIIVSLILLDLAIYGQHVAAHYVPMLWMFHKVHHSDVEFDVTTALRFHPIEIFISMLWKITLVFILGPSAFAVILFEIILNGCAMFNHSNLKLPLALDRFVRLFHRNTRYAPHPSLDYPAESSTPIMVSVSHYGTGFLALTRISHQRGIRIWRSALKNIRIKGRQNFCGPSSFRSFNLMRIQH